jgi:glutathione synthase/RimK-type ligase-like ATP-grasp enzyme
MNIGIVLNYKNAEKKKDELIPIDSKPWLKIADEVKYKNLILKKKDKKYVPADLAIGLYIESKFPDIKIDYITPDEISTRRFKKNDLVFIIIYDLLEAFHLTKKDNFNKFKLALQNSNNVYPPYQYQKFINNKCVYYKYLANKGLPVAPTQCVTKEKWYTRNPKMYISNLISRMKHNKWESIIAKPVYGQESKDFAKFIACKSNGLECQKKHLLKYFSKNIPKYKSIVIQEYIKGFDKSNPEIRTYFINGKYYYSIITTADDVEQPVQEGGKYPIPNDKWKYAMELAKQVMDSLPKIDLASKYPILTRIDLGSGLLNVPHTLFVNEVEFVPSLYIEDQNNPVVEKIADSLVEVTKEYKNKGKSTVKVNF